ncbi:MAG: cysteine hydrolase [Desulfobacteraceae bacterium]|jgi:nicotinamidase-related amidase
MHSVAVITSDLQSGIINHKKERIEATDEVREKLSNFYSKMRSFNVPIIHLQHVIDPENKKGLELVGDVCEGSKGFKIIDEFYHKTDILVQKRKFSGFFQTTLDDTLKGLGTKSIVLTGHQAQVCIQTTASDAFYRGFNVIVPKDGVISVYEEDKIRALDWIQDYVGQVLSLEKIINHLQTHDNFDQKTDYKEI